MAADERLTRLADFVTEHLAADAAVSIAALGEPDDDAYLAVHAAAAAFYAAGAGAPLGPLEGRWAVPGGQSPQANIDVSGSVAPGRVFAVGELADGDIVALVSSSRDPAAAEIAEALAVREVGGALGIVGRAALDPFTSAVRFEAAGGEPVDLGARPVHVLRLATPGRAEHAAFLDSWATT